MYGGRLLATNEYSLRFSHCNSGCNATPLLQFSAKTQSESNGSALARASNLRSAQIAKRPDRTGLGVSPRTCR